MRTRKKKFSDYGMTETEGIKVKAYCRHLTEKEKALLKAIAEKSAPGIGLAIYESLISGVGYYQLLKINATLPSASEDFYAYRRKTVAEFYQKVIKPANVRLP